MDAHPRQLPIPQLASEDARAIELLRVWAAGGQQHVSLATGIWKDPAAWGIMLVDLAKHIANAYQQMEGMEHNQTPQRIRAGLDAEWGYATDQPVGNLLDAMPSAEPKTDH